MVPVMPFVTRRQNGFQIKSCHGCHDVEADLSLNAHRLERNGISAAYETVCANAKTNGGACSNSTIRASETAGARTHSRRKHGPRHSNIAAEAYLSSETVDDGLIALDWAAIGRREDALKRSS